MDQSLNLILAKIILHLILTFSFLDLLLNFLLVNSKKCLAFPTAHRIRIRKDNFEFIPTEIVSDCTNVLISFILFLPCCNSDSVCLKVSNSYFNSDSISAVRRFILSLK